MKARNVGQLLPNYTWMMQKTIDPEATVKLNRQTDGEHEWDKGALTQLLRAGIVANVMLPYFGTISLVKEQLKKVTLN
jgi:hypothetical protein